MYNKKALVKLVLILVVLLVFSVACLLTPAEKISKDSILFMRFLGVAFLALFVLISFLMCRVLVAIKRAKASPTPASAASPSPPNPVTVTPLPGEELPPPVEKDGVFYCGYYKAPRQWIGDRIAPGTCQLCEQRGDCLKIHKPWLEPNNYVYYIPDFEKVQARLEAASAGVKHYQVCLDCLRRGRILHCHPTELGYLEPGGFPGKVLGEKQRRIPHRAIAELFRTPPIKTYQEEIWLTHCDDFMDFIGVWEEGDFAKHAPDGDAKKLYTEMTDDDRGWEYTVGGGETYYAFRCRHCPKLRGYSDID